MSIPEANSTRHEDSGRRMPPLSEALEDILTSVADIIRSEVRLLRAELSIGFRSLSRAGVFFLLGGVAGFYALGFVLIGAVYGLVYAVPWVPLWASALMMGFVLGAIGLVLLLLGRDKLNQTQLKPEKTIQSLEENVTWLKDRTK